MNEKIRELAERSGFMDTWFSESAEVDVEKFARLIVEDCAYIADKNHSLGVTTGSFMKRYFGVDDEN